MDISYANKLSTRLFAPLVLVFGVVIVVLMTYIPSITKQSAIEAAVGTAVGTAKQYKAIRGYYTNNVIKKVLGGSDLKPHFNHKGDAGKIPLPATFIHDLSQDLSDKGIITLKLYSPFPFPNRANRKLDDFGDQAWLALNKNPSKPFSQVGNLNGEDVVRVAVADTMVQQGCVDCHNTRLDTPKNDWKLKDVRGVLEVQVPISAEIIAAGQLSWTIAGIVILALSITVAILFFLFRKLISSRLRQLGDALNDIANGDGDLSQRLDETPLDEISLVSKEFNGFMSNMEKSLHKIEQEVGQLADTTTSMSQISETSQKNISALQGETTQISEAIEQMSGTASHVADTASQASEQSNHSHAKIEQSRETVMDNMNSVKALSDIMQEVNIVVANLETDSQNIGGVLDVIKGIAEQTNLLALNAAIEAARAGEQGRGFAVVADEVRTLASRTQESTEEINRMIDHLQNGSKDAVATMAKGSKSIEESLEKATQTNTLIDSIVESVTQIQALNSSIASSANEQTIRSSQINKNISNISQVSAETANSASQLLTVSNDINSAVQSINRQLKKFVN